MKRRVFIAGVVVVLASAACARADIARSSWSEGVLPAAAVCERLDASPQSSESVQPVGSVRLASFRLDLGDDCPQVPLASAPAEQVSQIKKLPADKNSMVLFMSAFAGLGALQLGRSAKHLHLGHMPDWYHTGGPGQIGHSVAIDLDFDAMPVCCTIEQTDEDCPVWQYLERELRSVFESQYFLSLTTPRAPPLLSA